jgi:peptide/nickel transport system substrate-binding protein
VSENSVKNLNSAYLDFMSGKIDRRKFALRVAASGVSVGVAAKFLAMPALAQDATPAAEMDYSYTSPTGAEVRAMQEAHFQFTEAESEGGTVIMGATSSATLSTTNPLLSNNIPTSPVLALAFESVVGIEMVTFQPVPGLADYYEIGADGKTYTFHLRQNVTWHDGTPFTADDVIVTFDAQADPATGTSYTADFVGAVESYAKVDDYTVTMVAKDVLAPVVFMAVSQPSIVPAHIWGDVPHADWATDPGSVGTDASRVIGTGPFKFVELNQTDLTATFAKNEAYYDKVPYIDTFIFQPWPDDTASVEALRAGSIDWLDPIPAADVDALLEEPNINITFYDTFSFGFYAYNMNPEKTTLFQDVRTRQALFYGLDRESIVANIYLGRAEVANGTQPLLSVAYAPDQINTIYNYDPEKAKALLAEAGWADSDGDGILELDGQKLEFSVMYGASSTSDQLTAYMADAWSELGVAMTPEPVDFTTVLVPAVSENFDFQIALLGFSWGPDGDQTAMFGSAYIDGAGFNMSRYINEEYDAIAEEANRTIDPAARRELLIEAMNIVNDDLPLAVINFTKGRNGHSTRLQNYKPTATSSGPVWSLPYVWIKE